MAVLQHPNVLYIITHDQGIAARCYAEYGPGASEKMVTPNIDALAARGALLSNHFGTAPQCSPARGSLITGKHPHQNGLVGLTHRGLALSNPDQTIYQHFQSHGYHTRLIGFQHEIQGDVKQLGYTDALHQGVYGNCHKMLPDVESSFSEFQDLNTQGTPFWLTIGAQEVHLIWGIRSKRKERFSPKDVGVPEYLPNTPKIRKHIGKLYGDLTSYDRFLGNVWTLMDKYDFWKNTVVIVTTDHGIAHPRAKGTLYNPGNHNLMLWAHPSIQSGLKVHSLLSSVDFAPTVCEMCGVPSMLPRSEGQPTEIYGKSYASLLHTPNTEETTPIHDYIYTELTFHDIYNPMRAIRSDRYKYIIHYEPSISLPDSIPRDIRFAKSFKEWVKHGNNTTRDREEFYDLQADPLELNNLLKGDQIPPEYPQMKAALQNFLETTRDPIISGVYPGTKRLRVDNQGDFPHLRN